MSENILTIPQIVENLRGMPKKFEAHNELGHLLVLDVENLADRIEEAVTNCNQLKMREALQRVVDWFNGSAFGDEVVEEMDSMIEYAETAIATPPRNCDRFNNIKEAKIRYCAEVGCVPIWDGVNTEKLINWLFDKAKGESK